jgi:hypothetical protein
MDGRKGYKKKGAKGERREGRKEGEKEREREKWKKGKEGREGKRSKDLLFLSTCFNSQKQKCACIYPKATPLGFSLLFLLLGVLVLPYTHFHDNSAGPNSFLRS